MEKFTWTEKTPWGAHAFISPWSTPSASANDIERANLSLAGTELNEARLDRLSSDKLKARLAALSQLDNTKQIEKHLLQQNVIQQYNLAISGGTEKMHNRLSLMFEDQKSDYKGDDLKRYLLNYKMKYSLNRSIEFNLNGSFNYNNDNYTGSSARIYRSLSPYAYSIKQAPYQMLLNEDGSLARWTNGPTTYSSSEGSKLYRPNFDRYVPKEAFPYSDFTFNPIEELASRDFSSKSKTARIQLGLNIKILNGLSLDTKFQYEIYEKNTEELYDEKSFEVRNRINELARWDRNTNVVTATLPKGGFLDKRNDRSDSWNFRNQINFNRSFGKHNISAIAGTEVSKKTATYWIPPRTYGYDPDRMSAGDFPNGTGGLNQTPFSYAFNPFRSFNDKYPAVSGRTPNIHGIRLFPVGGYRRDIFFSLYGNASYNYDDKYTLTVSPRTDASNFISSDNSQRYSPFWSVGCNWQVGREDFMKEIDFVDMLAFRMSYGFNGIANKLGRAQSVFTINPQNDPYSGELTSFISGAGNPDFGWEEVGVFNIGFDYSLLSGKLFGSLEYYNKKTSSAVLEVSLPSLTGVSYSNLNAAEMTNSGIELELGSRLPIKGREIQWTGNLSVSYNKNVIDKLATIPDDNPSALLFGNNTYLEGYNANTLWGLKYAGAENVGTPDQAWYAYDRDGNKFSTSAMWTLDGGPLKYTYDLGTTVAPYLANLRSNFKIYDFDLSLVFTSKFGHKFVRTAWGGSMPAYNTSVSRTYLQAKNANPAKEVPALSTYSEDWNYIGYAPKLDYLVENAGHIRFQEINLTYNMPNKFTSKYGLRNCKLYGQVNNITSILFSESGQDPEYGFSSPRAVFTFGLKCKF